MTHPLEEIQNPNTPAARLAELAQQHPEYGPQIAAHPNAYDGLRDWITQYATPPVTADTQAQQTHQLQVYEQAQPQPQLYAQAQPQAYEQPHAQPQPKKRKTGLIIGLSAGALALLLVVGGGLWWFFGSKVGGSPTAEAAAEKLITSANNLDPLALYGSLAPSEFALFETTSDALLELQSDENSQSTLELIENLEREIEVTTTTPLETSATVLVEDEVERVDFVSGVIEVDGDPDVVADVLMEFFAPIAQAQAEGMGYPITEDELDEMRLELADTLRGELPYAIDFSSQPFSLVSVHEPGGWYVSPLMSVTDQIYIEAGGMDEALGTEVLPAAEQGASSPDAAATGLTEAIFAGDYDAIVKQLPLAERRVASIYAPGFFSLSGYDPSELRFAMEDIGLTLDVATFTSAQDGSRGRIEVTELAFTSDSEDWYTGQIVEQRITVQGTCATVQGERPGDIYSEEYNHYYEDWLRDLDFPGSYSDYMAQHGLGGSEPFEETACLDEQPWFADLGVSEWRIIAIEEQGSWMVSPIATVADISSIVATKIQEAADSGRLNELFA